MNPFRFRGTHFHERFDLDLRCVSSLERFGLVAYAADRAGENRAAGEPHKKLQFAGMYAGPLDGRVILTHPCVSGSFFSSLHFTRLDGSHRVIRLSLPELPSDA